MSRTWSGGAVSERGVASRGRVILAAAVALLILVAAWTLLDGRSAPTGATGGEVSGMRGSAVTTSHTRLESTTPMPMRAPVVVAPARLRFEDEDGGAVAGAIVWAVGVPPEARAQLATSDEGGIAAPVITAPQTAIAITAPGYLERSLNLGPKSDVRVALRRAHALEIVCEDLTRRPLPGVFVAIAPASMPTDWLARVAEEGDVPTRQDDDPYVAITDAAGVARFAALPRFTVHWQVHTPEHALVEGPGITDAEAVTLPGRYRFRFAPLIAAGFVIHGDRFVSIAKLDMPGANLLPVDRGGAAQRAKAELAARFPDTHFFEVMAARDATQLDEFVVEALLEESGPHAVTLRWTSLAHYRDRGPQVVTVEVPPGPRRSSYMGRLLVRLRNPDGYEFVGRRMVLVAEDGRLSGASTGLPADVHVGIHRVGWIGDEAIPGYLQRPLVVDVVATGTEVTWTFQKPMQLVRFLFPEGLQGTPIVNVRNAEGKGIGASGRSGDKAVDMLLPEKPLRAFVWTGKEGPSVYFMPAPPSDPAEPFMTVQLTL
ncbi:MAG: hypothetical protein IPM13_19035 [Phycisphaerales bacterium]|nr:hypothetical protein [Phycisphaerales bacterium]